MRELEPIPDPRNAALDSIPFLVAEPFHVLAQLFLLRGIGGCEDGFARLCVAEVERFEEHVGLLCAGACDAGAVIRKDCGGWRLVGDGLQDACGDGDGRCFPLAKDAVWLFVWMVEECR